MSTATFGNVVTAMVSPFDEERQLDLDGARELARWLTRPGWNDGLVVNGTTGESTTTTDGEKRQLVEAVVEAVGGRAKVIAGVGTSDTRHSVELARAAEAAGADGLLVVTPYYSRPSQEGIWWHLRTIADSTGLPIMLYDIPKRAGVALEPSTLAAAAEHERIVALKDARGDLEAASWVIRQTGLAVYSGDDALNLPLLSVGAVGFVSVVGHVAADALRDLLDAYAAGDVARARLLHHRLLPIYRGMFRAPGAASAKAALAALGLGNGQVRPPLAALHQQERDLLVEALAEAGCAPTPVA
ncbi:4-hydroxy-tetrahydrodipicolinate synthase [Micromonospora carbonacea]|uniref:4-hydroxy-tetrahydrodipicolinate synthase n=1 Tax=Micromonospora carbonacea TaxID=47853 RepID=A0A1C5ATW1_9ACTN|nr:4-hydroxy-tetrahydrodipicolinate synthase [Micromonospora carbonacea]SCF48678.1 dihydrodipicolinate synthase [Micromonospora carbonacea]